MKLIKKAAQANDYPTILALWERSVSDTHTFLSDTDKAFFKEIIPTYFNQMELDLWYDQDNLIGFTAINQNNLEMFFLDPIFINQGYGSQILTWLIDNKNITQIEVNKQNKAATAFYLKHHFEVISESQTDGYGKPYPILHLKRKPKND